MTPEAKPRGKAPSRRARARLAAVQALYQIDLTAGEPAKVVAEFRQHRIDADGKADHDLFAAIVEGVSGRREEIDATLTPLLAEGWAMPRLETVLRAILRAGGFELLARGDVPARVVIDEYVNVARAFFSDKEPGVVNGILDKLARSLRADEFEGQPRAAEDPAEG
jgi:transcription antitermination protein NusB